MRVLQVAHALPPATYGGTELYTRDLAETLARQSHEVAVGAPRGVEDSEMTDVETFALPDHGGETAPALGGRPLEAVGRPAVDDQFRSLLADWNPDVVHLQHFKHLSVNIPEICRNRGVACVATLHDFWTICHREQLYRPEGRPCAGPESVRKCADCYRRAGGKRELGESENDPTVSGNESATSKNDPTVSENEPTADGGIAPASGRDSARSSVERRDARLREARSATDRLVAPSAFLRETFVEHGTPPEAIEQIRNGIRVERFEDSGFDPDGPLRVGYAGRITERKGVHLLVAAAREVEEVELHVFGRFEPRSDEYHARLAELARSASSEKRAGDATTFHGWYADRPDPYREMDVLVLPSIWYENSPLVIQEAFAAGVPVVTADAGGMAELVEDGEDGLTFPVGDADALADRLALLARNPELVADLRDGVSEPERLRDHAEEIANLYDECLARRN